MRTNRKAASFCQAHPERDKIDKPQQRKDDDPVGGIGRRVVNAEECIAGKCDDRREGGVRRIIDRPAKKPVQSATVKSVELREPIAEISNVIVVSGDDQLSARQ